MCTEETVMVTQNVGAYDIFHCIHSAYSYIMLIPHCIKLNSASSYIVGKDMSKHACLVLIEWSVKKPCPRAKEQTHKKSEKKYPPWDSLPWGHPAFALAARS